MAANIGKGYVSLKQTRSKYRKGATKSDKIMIVTTILQLFNYHRHVPRWWPLARSTHGPHLANLHCDGPIRHHPIWQWYAKSSLQCFPPQQEEQIADGVCLMPPTIAKIAVIAGNSPFLRSQQESSTNPWVAVASCGVWTYKLS